MIKHFFRRYLLQSLPNFFLQKLKLGNVYICTLRDCSKTINPEDDHIFAAVSCGSSHSWETAVIKALSEYVERRASILSGAASTTGFAAYPYIFRKKRGYSKAKKNAYYEIVERYSWPEWFYNLNISFQLKHQVQKKNESFYNAICNELSILKLYMVCPKLEDDNLKMVILYAITESGLVCGGALRQSEAHAEQNALKELYMHAVGLFRMKSHDIQATSDYEKRVLWISKQEHLLKNRLAIAGNEPIRIPFPIAYQDIKTEFDQIYVVRRCSLEGYNKDFISNENELYV